VTSGFGGLSRLAHQAVQPLEQRQSGCLACGVHVRLDGQRDQLEGVIQAFVGFADVCCSQQEGHALGLAPRRLRSRGRLLQPGYSRQRLASGLQMLRDPGGFSAVRLQPVGHLGMHMLRQQRRNAIANRLAQPVVRERRSHDHLSGLEFGPGIGERNRRLLEHLCRQRHTEVRAGHGRNPGQLERRRRQHGQLLLEQRLQRVLGRRPGQRAGRAGVALQPGVLQGLDREQRIATAAHSQLYGHRRPAQAVEPDRLQQILQRRVVQWRQDHSPRR
jgi:hypothetical protein